MPARSYGRLIQTQHDRHRDTTRFVFLETLNNLAPAVLRDLHTAYSAKLESATIHDWASKYKMDRPWVIAATDAFARLRPIRRAAP